MADNFVGIKFGVAGGSSISGESGQLIKSQLEALSKQVQLKVNIDKNHFTQQLTSLKAELEKTLGDLKITIKTDNVTATQGNGGTSSGGAGGSSADKQALSYDNLRKQLEALAVSQQRQIKAGAEGGVSATIAEQKIRDLTAAYSGNRREALANGNITEEQAASLDQYSASLERALQVEQRRASISDQASKVEMSYAKLQRNAQSLYTDGGFDKVIARSAEAKKLVDDFNAKVNSAFTDDMSIEDKQAAVRQLNQEFIGTQSQLKRIQKETDTLGNKLKDTFTSKLLQTFAYALIGIATRALKQVYENVVNLDKAITDLQIASGYTREETAKLVRTYSDLAKQLGATTLEVAQSADTWLRQGYSVEEANELIKNSMMLSKLGQIESAEAATALTSAMKGYKMEVEDSAAIVDKFTAVDMKAAVSAGDIATAMAETAASAEVAGISMDKLIGYIATVSEVTQDGAESVGTFYKTLFARMGNVSAGNFVDPDTGESLNDVEKTLNEVGISLRISETEFKEFGDVLDEVGAAWDTYDSVTQHALATAFAGTRQQEKFIVLMENYSSAMEYATVATESAGTAQKKYTDAYMESIDASINKLTTSWESFSQTILSSDIVVTLVDIMSTLVNVIDAVLSFGDSMIPTLALVGVSVVLLGKLITKTFGGALTSWGDFVAAIQLGTQTIGQALLTLAKNPMLYITVLITAFTTFSDKMPPLAQIIVGAVMLIGTGIAIACKMANTAIWGFMSSNPLGWILLAITAVVLAITSVVKAIVGFANASTKAKEEAVDAAEASKEAWEDAAKAVEDLNEKLESAKDRLKELQKQSNNGKITLVEQEEMERLEASIAQLEAEKELLEDVEKAKRKEAEKDASTAVGTILDEKLSDAYVQEDNTFWNGVGRSLASVLTLGISDAFGYGISDWSVKTTSAQDYVDQILGDWQNATEQQRNYVFDFYQQLSDQKDMLTYHSGENLEQWQKDANEAYNTYYKYLHKIAIAEGNFDSVWKSVITMERFPDIQKTLKQWANEGIVSTESIKNLYDTNPAFKQMVDYLIEIGMFSWEDASAIEGLVNQINAMADAAKVLAEKSFLDILNDIEGKFDALNSALESITDNGIVASDAIVDLLDKYPDLLKYFDMTNQGFQLKGAYAGWSNSDILNDFATGYLQKYVDELAACEQGTENYNIAQQNLNNAIAVMATLLRSAAIQEETEALEEQKDALEEELDKYKELIDMRKDLLDTYKEELDYRKELEKKQQNIASLQTQLSLARMDNSEAGKARARELQGEIDKAQDELDDFTLEHAIDALTAELDSSYDEYEKLIDREVDRITAAIDGLAASLNITPVVPAPTEQHHTGGFAGGGATLKDNEVFAKLLDGEFVSTPAQMSKFLKDTYPKMLSMAQGGNGGIQYNAPIVAIRCDSVTEDTMPTLKKVVKQAVDEVKKEIDSAFSRTGYRREVNKFSI